MDSISRFISRKKPSDVFDDDPLFSNGLSSGLESNQSLLVNDYLTPGGGGGGGGGGADESTIASSNRQGTSRRHRNITNGTGLYRDDSNDNPYNDESTQTIRQRFINIGKNTIFSAKVMNILGNVLAVVTLLGFLILVPWITAHAMIYDKARPDFAAFYSAGAFVLITVAMSMKLIYNHLTNWYMPDIQKFVVRIVWMVPIYSIQSWLSLRFHNARIYIDTLRDFYEAYVIQSFLYYLMELLGKLLL